MTAARRKPAPPAPAPAREMPQLGRFALVELTSRCCRWPTAEHPWLFCGAVREDDKRPYCRGHNAEAYAGRGTAAEAKIARQLEVAAKFGGRGL